MLKDGLEISKNLKKMFYVFQENNVYYFQKIKFREDLQLHLHTVVISNVNL